MTSALAATSMTVRVGAKTLLDQVTLVVAPGETIALVGPNGAGKSTLLRVLAGEIVPQAGTVALRGWPLKSYPARTLALHRAMLSQHTTVAFPFTVADVVRMGAGDRGSADALVASALAEVDLTAFGERVVTTLSGGEQQRAHFARVLVQLACGEAIHGPGLLMLDEPTRGIDVGAKKIRLDYLLQYGTGDNSLSKITSEFVGLGIHPFDEVGKAKFDQKDWWQSFSQSDGQSEFSNSLTAEQRAGISIEIMRNQYELVEDVIFANTFFALEETGLAYPSLTAGDDVNTAPVTPYQGLDHFGLTVKDIDAVAAEIKAKGVEFTKEPTTIRPGVRICFIRGPQGISVELLERDKKYA